MGKDFDPTIEVLRQSALRNNIFAKAAYIVEHLGEVDELASRSKAVLDIGGNTGEGKRIITIAHVFNNDRALSLVNEMSSEENRIPYFDAAIDTLKNFFNTHAAARLVVKLERTESPHPSKKGEYLTSQNVTITYGGREVFNATTSDGGAVPKVIKAYAPGAWEGALDELHSVADKAVDKERLVTILKGKTQPLKL